MQERAQNLMVATCGNPQRKRRGFAIRGMHNINLIDLYFTGQLLDISSPVTANSSSFYYVASEDLKFAPQLAIQADTTREWATCLVTRKEPNPWFKIEFKSTASIFNVRLVTRRQPVGQLPADYVVSGMDGLSVYVSNSSALGGSGEQRCGNSWQNESTNDILLDCGRTLEGRFVHVTVPSVSPTYLLICSIVLNREEGIMNNIL